MGRDDCHYSPSNQQDAEDDGGDDPILEFSRLLIPALTDEELPTLIMIGAYWDESESQAPHVFTLAGFGASWSAWREFTPKWRKMLESSGPYPVPAFHAADVEQGKPPFDGWTIEQRRALVDEAIDLLFDPRLCANLYAVGCTIVVADFGALLTSGNRPSRDIYELCCHTVFREIFQFSPFMGSDFVFDEKEKVKGTVKKHFDDARASSDADPRFRGKLNHCVFRDDRNVIPLQAADLLAYELRRRAWDLGKDVNTPRRLTYVRIMDAFLESSTTPPYRLRRFRRYDGRFVATLAQAAAADTLPPDAWFTLAAPED